MNFVRSSLKYPQVTITVLLLTFIAGVYALFEMPRREDAKINIREGQVIAFYPGANSMQVEEQVTRKLEQNLFQHEEVRREKTYSTTRDGAVFINVRLHDSVSAPDIFWSKLRHQLLVLKAVDLPRGVRGLFVNSDFSDTEALVIGVSTDGNDYARLRDSVRKVEDALRTIKAVSKIKRIGEQKEQIVVALDSARLERFGIPPSRVQQVLQSQNAIGSAGDVKTPASRVPLYSGGYYKTLPDVAGQIVGASRTGEVVRLRDAADVLRENKEPDSKVTVNGRNAILLAVEMHEGYNVVQYGRAIEKKLAEVSQALPSNIKITTVVNQPAIIHENVTHFLFEFFLAVIAVILVILLLLPLRVAAVAATAIPMTIAVTFAIMRICGIELHQVSLASLVVVLGMVVDDAVVIADNYVELLNQGVERGTAAWRSASELVVPVLTATAAIIAAFVPMVILTGATGEFMIALPLTVSIALASSFIVSMFLTPLLCFAFIREGLRNKNSEGPARKKRSVLGLMQSGYNVAIDWCMAHPRTTIIGCLSAIPLAFVMFQGIPQKFFPAAERNQFLVDLWMPTGTKLARTEESILKIQKMIEGDRRVSSYATFTGMSAPRFYYNFEPDAPDANFAQILVNTRSKKDMKELTGELAARVDREVPEGIPHVKILQQGISSAAPVEVRISGDDVNTLKTIGTRVMDIINKSRAGVLVRTDFKEDYYGIDIRPRDSAERLGFTTGSIAEALYAGFSGAPVSTLYEGDDAVDIVIRLDERKRRDTRDLQNMYLTSPVTGAAVPLRQIATLDPSWHTGRIIHRNGIPTLTVLSEPADGLYASQLLNRIRQEIDRLSLPPGYRIEYGGEYEGQNETFAELSISLAISLLGIFLILLFQFRNVVESLIVMLTIPLSAFGAMLGLLLTGNPFGFTAFVGLISLSGIVARNAIILVDHADELRRGGMDVRTAALEAGKRRLRPIFLTASAAAIGVIPMILSGSPLWSPLAAVISVGVMCSMAGSLLLVPVLYARVIRPARERQAAPQTAPIAVIAAIACALCFTAGAGAQAVPQRLDLQTVTDMAVKNNRLLGIKQMQIDERQHKVSEEKVKYLPSVILGSSWLHNSDSMSMTFPRGSFGQLQAGPMTYSLPASDRTLELSDRNFYNAGVALYQPVSQIPKISAAVGLSRTELEIARIEYAKAAMQTKQAAEKLYFGLLILHKQREEAEMKLALARSKLYDVESALLAGKATAANRIGLYANVADEEQNLLKINIRINNLSADLKHLIGLPPSGPLELEPVAAGSFQYSAQPAESYAGEALTGNKDLKMAQLNKLKTDYAIKANRYSYLPDFGIVGGYTYQDGIYIDPANNAFIGVAFKWDFKDVVSNTFVGKQRSSMKKQAEELVINTREQVAVDIDKACRKLSESAELISAARKVADFRREDLKVQSDRRDAGLGIESEYIAAKAAMLKAEADLYAAQLNYRTALTELQILTGGF
jgi:multidrug efflux pump subunit AcrB